MKRALLFAITPLALQSSLQTIRDHSHVPALGVMAIEKNRTLESAIVGVRKSTDSAPAKIEDQFHLGSCTKAMTATLTAILIEEGRLSWNTPLKKIYGDLPALDPTLADVTIEMLLAHRAGLVGDLLKFQDGALFKRLRDPQLTPTEGRELVAKTLLQQKPAATPGSKFIYSNASYIIVGHALEKLTGETWEKLIQKKLFDPLAMTSCGFGPPGNPSAASPDQPWGHQLSKTIIPVPPRPETDNPPAFAPAGTVHCSMQDWGKFLTLHIDGFNQKPTPLLSRASFKKLHQPLSPGQSYTVGGWFRDTRSWAGGTILTHQGSNTLNTAVVWLAPLQQRALMAVTNLGTKTGSSALDEAISSLIKRLP